ncbi:hypothetical protein DF040_01620 [Burkholderia cenocepacia]|nr:hypothetical protein DF040_01620 [Burkholderia cenocepacia]
MASRTNSSNGTILFERCASSIFRHAMPQMFGLHCAYSSGLLAPDRCHNGSSSERSSLDTKRETRCLDSHCEKYGTSFMASFSKAHVVGGGGGDVRRVGMRDDCK